MLHFEDRKGWPRVQNTVGNTCAFDVGDVGISLTIETRASLISKLKSITGFQDIFKLLSH